MSEDWQTQQSRNIGEIKRLLKQVIETQKLHSQRFESQGASIDNLRDAFEELVKGMSNLVDEILSLLESQQKTTSKLASLAGVEGEK